jgi:phenylpropionate dioxygenase-like ring-hydroxylating dioxygenase large terminal subunit
MPAKRGEANARDRDTPAAPLLVPGHAVAMLAEGPKPFRLLGRDLVLWLDGEGTPSAMDDRCCHRTAKLSKGFYSNGWLACGYHGWEFGADGRVMRVPQRPVDRQGATNMRVPSYRAAARYGYVWVALEEPLFDIPTSRRRRGLPPHRRVLRGLELRRPAA